MLQTGNAVTGSLQMVFGHLCCPGRLNSSADYAVLGQDLQLPEGSRRRGQTVATERYRSEHASTNVRSVLTLLNDKYPRRLKKHPRT